MAHRSHRCEEDRIRFIFEQHSGNLRSSVCNQPAWNCDRAHKAEMTWRNRTDDALLCQALQAIKRQGQILVRRDPANVERIASISYFERTQVRVGRDDAIRIVSSPNSRIKLRLVWSEESGRRHDRDPAVEKRLLQVRARPPIDPAIWVSPHEKLIGPLEIADLRHVICLVSAGKACFLTTLCRSPRFL